MPVEIDFRQSVFANAQIFRKSEYIFQYATGILSVSNLTHLGLCSRLKPDTSSPIYSQTSKNDHGNAKKNSHHSNTLLLLWHHQAWDQMTTDKHQIVSHWQSCNSHDQKSPVGHNCHIHLAQSLPWCNHCSNEGFAWLDSGWTAGIFNIQVLYFDLKSVFVK
jgi:hypothetical protein